MEIWDRMRDKEGKLEPIKAFTLFNEYLLMDKPRSMKVLCEKLGLKPNYIRQLHSYSSKWEWVKRAEAYDEYIILKKRATKEKFYDELVNSELPNLKERLNFYNKNMVDIEQDVKAKPTSKANAFEKNSKAHSTTLNEILVLVGKPTEISSVEADVISDTNVKTETHVEVDVTSDEFMERELEYLRKLLDDE